MTTFDLNKHTARLLMDEPFFAALSRRIDKRASTAIPTAGVKVDKDSGHFVMIYNPEFFETLTDVQKLGVLKHEFYHLVFEHVTGRLPEGGMSKLWNIATDLAINSHLINELPEMCCMPGQGPFADLPVGKSGEWYYNKLKDERQSNKRRDATRKSRKTASQKKATVKVPVNPVMVTAMAAVQATPAQPTALTITLAGARVKLTTP